MSEEITYPEREPGAGTGRVYEDDLRKNFRYAVNEGGRHFDKDSLVYQTMRKIAARLDELQIPYVVVGGMALIEHGFRRFTEDVDLLVTAEGKDRIHCELVGRGYRPVFTKSKNLRDTESGVRIEFLISGNYPGDGKPKPIAFPDPSQTAETISGVRVINLKSLIELKLASGMTNPDRLKDLADVQELIKAVGLSREFADSLSPYVRDKYLDVFPRLTKYVRLMPRSEVAALQSMVADGVILNAEGNHADEYAKVFTFNSALAHKYDMHPEDEYKEEDDSDDIAG